MARKNTKIHFVIETSTKELLIREAQMQEVSLAELCRQKLKRNSKLLKIEQATSNEMVKIMAIRQFINQNKDLLKMQLDVGVFEENNKNNGKEISNIPEILRIIDNAERQKGS